MPGMTAECLPGSGQRRREIGAHAAMPGTAGIGALNSAVEALVRLLAVELARSGSWESPPGFVDTPWWSGLPDKARRDYFAKAASVLPTRRIATAEDIAAVVAL